MMRPGLIPAAAPGEKAQEPDPWALEDEDLTPGGGIPQEGQGQVAQGKKQRRSSRSKGRSSSSREKPKGHKGISSGVGTGVAEYEWGDSELLLGMMGPTSHLSRGAGPTASATPASVAAARVGSSASPSSSSFSSSAAAASAAAVRERAVVEEMYSWMKLKLANQEAATSLKEPEADEKAADGEGAERGAAGMAAAKREPEGEASLRGPGVAHPMAAVAEEGVQKKADLEAAGVPGAEGALESKLERWSDRWHLGAPRAGRGEAPLPSPQRTAPQGAASLLSGGGVMLDPPGGACSPARSFRSARGQSRPGLQALNRSVSMQGATPPRNGGSRTAPHGQKSNGQEDQGEEEERGAHPKGKWGQNRADELEEEELTSDWSSSPPVAVLRRTSSGRLTETSPSSGMSPLAQSPISSHSHPYLQPQWAAQAGHMSLQHQPYSVMLAPTYSQATSTTTGQREEEEEGGVEEVHLAKGMERSDGSARWQGKAQKSGTVVGRAKALFTRITGRQNQQQQQQEQQQPPLLEQQQQQQQQQQQLMLLQQQQQQSRLDRSASMMSHDESAYFQGQEVMRPVGYSGGAALGLGPSFSHSTMSSMSVHTTNPLALAPVREHTRPPPLVHGPMSSPYRATHNPVSEYGKKPGSPGMETATAMLAMAPASAALGTLYDVDLERGGGRGKDSKVEVKQLARAARLAAVAEVKRLEEEDGELTEFLEGLRHEQAERQYDKAIRKLQGEEDPLAERVLDGPLSRTLGFKDQGLWVVGSPEGKRLQGKMLAVQGEEGQGSKAEWREMQSTSWTHSDYLLLYGLPGRVHLLVYSDFSVVFIVFGVLLSVLGLAVIFLPSWTSSVISTASFLSLALILRSFLVFAHLLVLSMVPSLGTQPPSGDNATQQPLLQGTQGHPSPHTHVGATGADPAYAELGEGSKTQLGGSRSRNREEETEEDAMEAVVQIELATPANAAAAAAAHPAGGVGSDQAGTANKGHCSIVQTYPGDAKSGDEWVNALCYGWLDICIALLCVFNNIQRILSLSLPLAIWLVARGAWLESMSLFSSSLSQRSHHWLPLALSCWPPVLCGSLLALGIPTADLWYACLQLGLCCIADGMPLWMGAVNYAMSVGHGSGSLPVYLRLAAQDAQNMGAFWQGMMRSLLLLGLLVGFTNAHTP